MIVRRPPFLSLSKLRHSVRWAVFALAVFVLRLCIVAACEPSDFAELFSGQTQQHVVDSASGAPSDPSPGPFDEHQTGHCLHCGCHFPVALPASPDAIIAAPPHFVPPSPSLGLSDAPPGRQLRPPIA